MQSNYKRWIVAALPLAMACTVSAQGKVTDVSTRQIDGGIAVHIGGSDLATPTTKWDNGALVVTFQANLEGKSKTWRPGIGGIKAISFRKEGSHVNVAVRPSEGHDPQIVKVADGWLVYFEQEIGALVPAIGSATTSTAKKPASTTTATTTHSTTTASVAKASADNSQKAMITALTVKESSKPAPKTTVATHTASTAKTHATQKIAKTAVKPVTAKPVHATIAPAIPDQTSQATAKHSSSKAAKFAPVNPRDFKSKALVTLNFVDTDVQQILKALSIQANVNVAMGPDVTGKVTINLDNVPVDEAMEMVTTLGGVEYAYVNNTYMVASPGKFPELMEKVYHRHSETRVVPLFSREGNQVKAAMLKMVPTNAADGKYELVLPSEKLNVYQAQNLTPQGGASKDDKNSGSDGGNQVKMQQLADSGTDKKDDYIVLIGTPERMDGIERAVRDLDQRICMALGIKVGTSQATIRKTYEPKGILAVDLVKALVGGDKKEFNNVQVIATPGNSVSRQAVELVGREADVDKVWAMLTDIDRTPDSADTAYEVVGLKYIKPNLALIDVLQNVPGIRANLLPAPVDPKVGLDYSSTGQQGLGNGGSAGAPDAGAGAAQGGSSQAGGPSSGSSSGGSGSPQGGSTSTAGGLGSNGQAVTSVTTSTKSNSVPMKLLLRGTQDQIEAAKRYLAMVDLQPKQVAIELRVMEISKEDALKVGLDWSVLTGGTVKSIRINQGINGADDAGSINGQLGWHNGGAASIVGALDSISTKANVLARPSILVNDGVPTNMFVGDEVRYIKSILTSANNPPTVTTDEVDVGVDFAVTARVGDGGNIMVDLNPTLKVLEGFTPVPGGGNLPQTSRRSAESIMSMKSGETIAIGGLIQDQDRKSRSGIPILKDLPLIGYLFSRTNNDKVRTEVVFFVTVKEVTESDRQGAANPNQAEKTNKDWPGQKDNKRGG